MKKRFSIIIVNFNSEFYTLRCIDSICVHEKYLLDIIVIDNSKERSVFLNSDSRVRYFHIGKNIGFGAACNYGVMHAQHENLVFINPDIIILRDIFLAVEKFDLNKFSVGGRLVDEKKENTISYGNFPTLFYFICSKMKLNYLFKCLEKNYAVGLNGDHIKNPEEIVDYLSGALFFISKKNYNSVDGFDEDYFLYYEETDLFYRLKIIGVKCIIDNQIYAIHTGGVTTSNSQKIKALKKSHILYFKKRGNQLAALIVGLLG